MYLAYRNDLIGGRFDFEIETFKLPFFFELDPVSIARIISVVREKQIDILIPTKRKDYVLAGIAARICKRKNVLRLGIVRDLHNEWHNNLVYNKLTDGIIVNAEQIKSVLLKSRFMREEKIRVIYNGLDLDLLDQGAANKDFREETPFLITSVGRVTNRKGFARLISGFQQFVLSVGADDSRLQIIGAGHELNRFKKMAEKLEISDKVAFTGFVRNPYPHLAASDVFVLLSKNEGIPNALLEAMYLKNAVIITRTGGVAEIIRHGENGYLLDETEVFRVGEFIKDLYLDPEKRRRMGEAAHRTVLEKFSLQTMKEGIERFLQKLLQPQA